MPVLAPGSREAVFTLALDAEPLALPIVADPAVHRGAEPTTLSDHSGIVSSVLRLLIALNSGLPGMATVHANSAREAVTKLCTLPLLAGPNVTADFVVPTVASAVDLVVHVALEADGRRRVREVLAVPGRVEAGVVETGTVFGTVLDGGSPRLVRGTGTAPHEERFARAGYDVAALLREQG